MPAPTPVTCQHELRPGTRVCLHCRRAEREAKAARQRAVLTRVGVTGAAIAAVAYAGLAGFRAWQGNGSPSLRSLVTLPASLEAAPVRTLPVSAPSARPAATLAVNAMAAPLTGDSTSASDSARSAQIVAAGDSTLASSAPAESAVVAAPAAPAAMAAPVPQPIATPAAPPVVAPPAPVAAPPVAPPLKPSVAEGRTELENGIYAVRRGDTVTVHFDTPEARTRRPEKFEQILRATLPVVHGAAAASILSSIASGNLVGPGDSIIAPQAGGISLRGGNGAALSVVPQTRPGRDGPLVVAYRVVPAR